MIAIRTFAQLERLTQHYPSSSFEQTEGTVWIRCQARRHFRVLEAYSRYRPGLGDGPIRIADVGAYPGTLLKCLRLLCKEEGPLVGIGLEGAEPFVEHLAEHGIAFHRANLDPIIRTDDPVVEALPGQIPLDDESVDLAFCTEALEHVLDPMHALGEIRRVLKPGGLFLATTPNQAKLRNRLKRMLFGESIYYPLTESVPHGLTNWRPHMRECTMAEFTQLVKRAASRSANATSSMSTRVTIASTARHAGSCG